MQNDLVTYYGRRSREYEQVYTKPERQQDLARLRELVREAFIGEHVLEVSCGTAHWTESFASVAKSVVACDGSLDMLEIARAKTWGLPAIEFHEADSYALPAFDRRFSAGFAGFWWSHIPKRKLRGFLAGFHERLEPGAKVMFIDNRYVEGNSTPASRTDEHGDSYQLRQLADGSTHEVLKNFPSESELLDAVDGKASGTKVTLTDYFWALTYQAD